MHRFNRKVNLNERGQTAFTNRLTANHVTSFSP